MLQANILISEIRENLLGASTIIPFTYVRLMTFTMLINLRAILADTLIASISIATFTTSAKFIIVRALIKVIACLLIIRQPKAFGTRACVGAFGVVAGMTALVTIMLALVNVDALS